MSERLNRQKDTRWIMKLHRHLVKPPYPVLVGCPNCMHPLVEVNATTIEIENTIGFGGKDVLAKDAWLRIRHTCGAKITLYWNE